MKALVHHRQWSVLLAVAAVLATVAAGAQEPARLTVERHPQPREIVVASPRASIAWAVPHKPVIAPEETVDPVELPTFQVGAVENFAASGVSITVRKDSVVFFRESRQVEGVWYERTYGRLGTVLVVQMQNPSSATPEWITLGRDGAGAIRRGPRIGTARIGVPVRFPRVGVYRLRAAVITGAIPMEAPVDSVDSDPVDSPYADFDFDFVPIRVTVVDVLDPADIEPQVIPRGPDLGYGEPLERMFQE